MWLPPEDNGFIEDHRAVWAWVSGDGIPRVAAYSLYLRDGQGPSDTNLESMRKVCCHVRGHGECFIVGADWNMGPATVAGLGFVDAIGGRVLAGPSDVGTCTSAIPASNLDFFVVDARLMCGFHSVRIQMGGVTSPHRAVQAGWKVSSKHAKVTRIVRKRLPVDRVYGPLQPEQDWTTLTNAISTVQEELELGAGFELTPVLDSSRYGRALATLAELHKRWNDLAKVELANRIGVDPAQTSGIGKDIETKEVSALGGVKDGRLASKCLSHGLEWSKRRAAEQLALITKIISLRSKGVCTKNWRRLW